MKYKDKGNIREYIMQMSHITSKLKTLKLELSEDLLVHLVLISLPTHFSQLRSVITVRRRNGLCVSSFHIVCKKRKGLRMRTLKVLIWLVPQKIRVRKKKKNEAAKSRDQKKPMKNEDCFFCKKP